MCFGKESQHTWASFRSLLRTRKHTHKRRRRKISLTSLKALFASPSSLHSTFFITYFACVALSSHRNTEPCAPLPSFFINCGKRQRPKSARTHSLRVRTQLQSKAQDDFILKRAASVSRELSREARGQRHCSSPCCCFWLSGSPNTKRSLRAFVRLCHSPFSITCFLSPSLSREARLRGSVGALVPVMSHRQFGLPGPASPHNKALSICSVW
jgi:hypothetical protein